MLELARTVRAIRPALAFGIAMAAPATATVLTFSGTATAFATVGPDESCAPLPFRGIVLQPRSSGASNLGGFTYSHDICFAGAIGGRATGVFTMDFGKSSISGRLDGSTAPRAGVPGSSDQFFTYTLVSGTGRFAGATGSIVNVGTVDSRGGPPSRLALNFKGTIDAPAMP